jgi:hypothetical protein
MTLKITLQKTEFGWDDLVVTSGDEKSLIRIESISRDKVRLQINGSHEVKYTRVPVTDRSSEFKN